MTQRVFSFSNIDKTIFNNIGSEAWRLEPYFPVSWGLGEEGARGAMPPWLLGLVFFWGAFSPSATAIRLRGSSETQAKTGLGRGANMHPGPSSVLITLAEALGNPEEEDEQSSGSFGNRVGDEQGENDERGGNGGGQNSARISKLTLPGIKLGLEYLGYLTGGFSASSFLAKLIAVSSDTLSSNYGSSTGPFCSALSLYVFVFVWL